MTILVRGQECPFGKFAHAIRKDMIQQVPEAEMEEAPVVP